MLSALAIVFIFGISIKQWGVSIIKQRTIWTVGSIIALCVGFYLCRYTFFHLHGNDQWLILLFVIGLVVLTISAIKDYRKIMACTVIAYIGGFTMGQIFSVDEVDPSGGVTNNWWVIWTISFIAIIIIGAIWEATSKRKK